jgi:hypothetical protein
LCRTLGLSGGVAAEESNVAAPESAIGDPEVGATEEEHDKRRSTTMEGILRIYSVSIFWTIRKRQQQVR